MAVEPDRRLRRKQAELLAIGAEGEIERLGPEAEPARRRDHVLARIDQDRIGRRRALANGEGDQPAIDPHRLLQFVLEHLLDEGADIELAQLNIARPEAAGGHHERDPSVRIGERIVQAVAAADELDPPLDRPRRPRLGDAEPGEQPPHRGRGQADVVARLGRPAARVEHDVGRDIAARHREGQRRELEHAVLERERQVDVRDRHVLRTHRANRPFQIRIERVERGNIERRVGQQARRCGTRSGGCRLDALGRDQIRIVADERREIDDVDLLARQRRIDVDARRNILDREAPCQIARAEAAAQMREGIGGAGLHQLRLEDIGARLRNGDADDMQQFGHVAPTRRHVERDLLDLG